MFKRNNQQIQNKIDNIHGKNKIIFLGRLLEALRGRFKCNTCGYIWETSLGGVLSGAGCTPCSYEERGWCRRQSDKQIQTKINKIHGSKITFLGRVSYSIIRKGRFRCTSCGHTWETTMDAVLSNSQGCKLCSYRKRNRYNKYSLKYFNLNGKKVAVQGYEPQALKWLRDYTNLEASQVVAGNSTKIPIIDYYDTNLDKWRLYFPDFYIPSSEIIVEVKSLYTLLKNKEGFQNVKDKKIATEDEGYRFRLMVMKDAERLKISSNWYELGYNKITKMVDK